MVKKSGPAQDCPARGKTASVTPSHLTMYRRGRFNSLHRLDSPETSGLTIRVPEIPVAGPGPLLCDRA
jgi:hypothetical protein